MRRPRRTADRQEGSTLEPIIGSEQIAIIAAQAAADKKATDLVVLDVAATLVITEYFVIVTGATDRQVSAIADEVEDRIRDEVGMKPIGREGQGDKTWVLLDYGDVVVHVFQPEAREFYRLEKLWSDARRVDVPDIEEAAAVAPVEDAEAPRT